VAINQRNERTQKAERDSRDFRTRTVAETRMKRDNTFREKRGQNKKISLAFSLSLSLSRVFSSILRLGEDTNLI
jgi:hypothetical protein